MHITYASNINVYANDIFKILKIRCYFYKQLSTHIFQNLSLFWQTQANYVEANTDNITKCAWKTYNTISFTKWNTNRI